jgi:hypothetical protein
MTALVLVLAFSWSAFAASVAPVARDPERLCAVVLSSEVDAAALGPSWAPVRARIVAQVGAPSRARADSLRRDARRAWLTGQSALSAGGLTARSWAATGLARAALAVAEARPAVLAKARGCAEETR